MTKRLLSVAVLLLLLAAGCSPKQAAAMPTQLSLPSTEASAADAAEQLSAASAGTELGVNYTSAKSPDGLYLAETYGINTRVTSGGLYPAEGIRLTEISTGKSVWRTGGYYDTKFLWSDDSRYLAVTNMTRTEFCTMIVDTVDFKEIPVPYATEMLDNMRDYRPDPYIKASGWDGSSLKLETGWIGRDEKQYAGVFVFEPSMGTISHVEVAAVPTG